MICSCQEHGGCKQMVKSPYTKCYTCYHGHQIDERDNDPNDGNDEIGYQKGEDPDFMEWLDQDQKQNEITGN